MLFSIVVPCYNASERIEELFQMLSSKDYSNYEVVFVDDCSKDNTYDTMLKTLEKSDSYSNFKVMQTPENGGPGPARNAGILSAEGEYILFCDSDDIFDISCLTKIESFLQNHPDADIIVSPHTVIRGKSESVSDAYSKYSDGDKITKDDVVIGYGGPVAKVFKKEIISANAIEFPARMTGEDACFVINYAVFVKNGYKMDFSYYSYVMNDASITHTHKEDWKMPTTFEVLLPLYEEHFPNVVVQRYIEGHLLTKAKLMTRAGCKNSEIKKWFKEENQRYPDWYEHTAQMDRSLYRRMIYFAMHKSSPILIKFVMGLRRILY